MLMGVAEFERLFRLAASLDVDKDDLKRLSDFVRDKLHDLLIMAERTAKANGRDIILDIDVPVTKGLQELIREFETTEVAPKLEPILDQLVHISKLDLGFSEELQGLIPKLAGALTMAVAKTMKAIDPELKNPQTEHWEQAEMIFNLLL